MSDIENDEKNYIFLKTISNDKKIKIDLYKHRKTQKKFIIKKFQKENQKMCQNEYNIHKKLNHKNIIKTISQIKTQKTLGIKMEYAPLGDFFTLITKKSFSENLSRFYALQLLNALFYLKKKKIAHRDLKPENLLLSSNYTLKTADFGLSTNKTEKKNRTIVGTRGYMPPEFYELKNYCSEKSDIFAFGVILFIFVLGRPPFENAILDDVHYKCFLEKKRVFWQYHCRISGAVSESFVIMVNNLLGFCPKKRFTFEQLSECYWMRKGVDQGTALQEIKGFFN